VIVPNPAQVARSEGFFRINFGWFVSLLERFSDECRKTKTKVITPNNHNTNKTQKEPILGRKQVISVLRDDLQRQFLAQLSVDF